MPLPWTEKDPALLARRNERFAPSADPFAVGRFPVQEPVVRRRVRDFELDQVRQKVGPRERCDELRLLVLVDARRVWVDLGQVGSESEAADSVREVGEQDGKGVLLGDFGLLGSAALALLDLLFLVLVVITLVEVFVPVLQRPVPSPLMFHR
jgi:hypothetical protein